MDSSENEESGKGDDTKSDNSSGEEEDAHQSLVATTQPALESAPVPNLPDMEATYVNNAEKCEEPLQEATKSALSSLSALTLDTDGNGEKRGRSSADNDSKDVDRTKKPRGGSLSASASRLVQNLRNVFKNGGLRFVEKEVDGEPDAYLLVINGPNGEATKSESQFGNKLSGFSLSPLRAVGVPETPAWINNYWAPGSCISNVATQELLEANNFVRMTSSGGTYWSIMLHEALQRGIVMDARELSKWVLNRAPLSGDSARVRVHSEGLRKPPTRFDGSWSDLNLPEITDAEFDQLAQAWLLETEEAACNVSAQRYYAIASMGANPYQVDLQPCMGSKLSTQVAEAMSFGQSDSMESLLPLAAPDSAFDAQIESLERLKNKPKPEPKEYDSFVDWHLSNEYTSWSERYYDKTYNWPKVIDVYDDDPYFGPPFKIPKKKESDFYITKTKAWVEDSRPGEWYKQREDFIPTDKVQLATRWAVQADDVYQQGFFKVDALEKMYKNMIVDGMVAFSVFDGTPDAPGKAIEFFPKRYVCQSVPWWYSKLKYLPLTMRLRNLGSGSFNKAERLENHLNLVAFSVVVEPEAWMSWETLASNVWGHQQAVLVSEEHKLVHRIEEATLLDVQIVREMSLMTIVYHLADDKAIDNWDLKEFCEDVNKKLRFPEAWVGYPVKEVVSQAKIVSGPDISLFLPDLRLAYGLEDKNKIKRICNDADKWGLVLRTAFVDKDDISHKTTEHALREVMLSSYAAANGFGPRIFAQWIVPENAYHYEMRMNVGEICEHFADGMAEVERSWTFGRYSIPLDPWCQNANWTNSGKRYDPFQVPSSRQEANISENGPNKKMPLEWRKACMLMEGFEDNVARLRTSEPEQDSLFMDALFEQCERMGQAGILHGDIKMENSVYRVWKHAPGDTHWNRITVRFIDFDPFFCKLVPFIPSEVLTLINFTLYMTSVTCNYKVPKTGLSWRTNALEKIRPLLKEINKKYGNDASPVASAFRALRPTFYQDEVPQTMVGPDGKEREYIYRGEAGWILYNDEWEAARMFRWNVAHYFERGCGGRYINAQGGVRAPMIARLLSFITDRSQYLAPEIWKNDEDDGAFRLPSGSGSDSDSESDSGSNAGSGRIIAVTASDSD